MKLSRSMLAVASACLALFSVALFFSGSAVAAYNTSANTVMKGCRSYIAGDRYNEPFLQGVCTGEIDAIVDLSRSCAPNGSTLGQAVRVVAAYIDARPARSHEDFSTLALEALKDAWPCR